MHELILSSHQPLRKVARFADEKTEVQKGRATCSRSQVWLVEGLGIGIQICGPLAGAVQWNFV